MSAMKLRLSRVMRPPRRPAHPHSGHGPGGGISSHQPGAARADRVDHQRDGASELAGDRQPVTELNPPHTRQPERLANRSQSALPSRWAPSRAPRPLAPDVRPSGGPSAGGRLACHCRGAAPHGRGGWFRRPESPASRSRPGRAGRPGRSSRQLAPPAPSPNWPGRRDGIAISCHADIVRATLVVLKR